MTREEAIKRLYELQFYSSCKVDERANMADIWRETVSALDMAIAALREHPKWISVEERLPEGGGSVLIYSPFGGVAEGTYSEHYKRWVQYRWSVFEPEVTHWMPLPKPPKEEV